MPPLHSYSRLYALAALTAFSAHAQVAVATAGATPSPMRSIAPAMRQLSESLPYRSVFEGYQPFTDAKPKPWIEVNATVETLGGRRTNSKEASEPMADDSMIPASIATPGSPPPDPHTGHHMHGK
ncbi:MAG: hypothetical protein ABIZ09_03890 [Rhodoferax sp.]